MKKLNLQLFTSNYLWFEPLNANVPEASNLENNPSQPVATFTSNFDYEILPRNIGHVYIDIGIEMIPAAAIMVRSGFVFNNKDLKWDDVFTSLNIVPIVHKTIRNCIDGFKEQCLAFNIPMPGTVKEDDEITFAISKNIIDQYFTYRQHVDIAYSWLMDNPGLEFPITNETMITLKGTFAIIDEVLYRNAAFDRAQNLEIFNKIVPEGKYFTLKINCIAIDKNPVRLSLYNINLFYHCLECALQLIAGDKAEALIPALGRNGMTKEVQDIFTVSGAEMLYYLYAMLEDSKAQLWDREKQPDWNKLIGVKEGIAIAE